LLGWPDEDTAARSGLQCEGTTLPPTSVLHLVLTGSWLRWLRWAVMCWSVTGATLGLPWGAKRRGPTRMLAYLALVNNTASLWSVPRASAMNFPSGDQP
jgi:hypothetical protein